MAKKKIKLGDKVKDTITDLEGTVVAITRFLNGCIQCEVQPKELKDGKIVDSAWIDEPQLVKVAPIKKLPIKKVTFTRKHGGIRNHPR